MMDCHTGDRVDKSTSYLAIRLYAQLPIELAAYTYHDVGTMIVGGIGVLKQADRQEVRKGD